MLINIGTSKGNLTKVKINKPFDEISAVDIFNILQKKGWQDANIYCWAPTPVWYVSECYALAVVK